MRRCAAIVAARTTSSTKEDNDEDAFQRRGSTHSHLDRRRCCRAPATTSTNTTTCDPRKREVHLSSRRITNFNGGSGPRGRIPSTGTNERSSSTAFSRERKQQNETRERHERARLSTRRASLPPSFFLLLPSRLLSGTPQLRLPLLLPPLSSSISLSLSLFFSPSFGALLLRPLFLSVTLYPRRGSFLPLDSPTRDRSPNHAGRVPDESSTCSSSSPARDRRLTRPRESFSERVIKAPLREGEGIGKHEAQV